MFVYRLGQHLLSSIDQHEADSLIVDSPIDLHCELIKYPVLKSITITKSVNRVSDFDLRKAGMPNFGFYSNRIIQYIVNLIIICQWFLTIYQNRTIKGGGHSMKMV